MTLMDAIKAQDTNYTPSEIKEVSQYLKQYDVGLAYYKFWLAHLRLRNSELPNPTASCNWKEPDYATGLPVWLEICQINKWS